MKTITAAFIAFVVGLMAMWMVGNLRRDGDLTELKAGTQVAAALSPDNVYEAKVWLQSLDGLGATISQPHQVWIGRKSGGSRLVLEADKTDGIRISWRTGRILEICYADAQISRFTNRFVDVDRSRGVTQAETIEITLRREQRLDQCR